jgi:hypothetical protein
VVPLQPSDLRIELRERRLLQPLEQRRRPVTVGEKLDQSQDALHVLLRLEQVRPPSSNNRTNMTTA